MQQLKVQGPLVPVMAGLAMVGLALATSVLPSLEYFQWWQRSQRFVAVPAQLEIAQWTARGKKTQYCFEVVYRYQWEGQDWRGNRFGLENPSYCFAEPENSSNPRYSKAIEAKQAESQIAIWLDPHNPGSALIDREVYWEHFFPGLLINLVTLSLGVYVATAALRNKWAQRRALHE